MTLRIVFRHAAKSEFEDAAVCYDEQRLGIGEEFTSKSSRPSPELRPHRSAIQLYSAIFDAQSRAAFPFPSTSGFGWIRWLCLRFFTVAAIRPFGNVGYNYRWNGQPAGALPLLNIVGL
jgi:hypothetical protein